MIVKRLEKTTDGVVQNIWESGNGKIFSGAVHCTDEILNPVNGFVNVEKFVFWVKTKDAGLTDKHVGLLLKSIKAGKLRPYRVFSETPFYDGDEPDSKVNDDGEVIESLGRYSQTRLGPPDTARRLHRTYIEVSLDTTEDSAEKQEPVTVESGAESVGE